MRWAARHIPDVLLDLGGAVGAKPLGRRRQQQTLHEVLGVAVQPPREPDVPAQDLVVHLRGGRAVPVPPLRRPPPSPSLAHSRRAASAPPPPRAASGIPMHTSVCLHGPCHTAVSKSESGGLAMAWHVLQKTRYGRLPFTHHRGGGGGSHTGTGQRRGGGGGGGDLEAKNLCTKNGPNQYFLLQNSFFSTKKTGSRGGGVVPYAAA